MDREMNSASLFNIKTLTSFQELYPFFNALATQHDSIKCPSKIVPRKSSHISDATVDVELDVIFAIFY